METMETSKDFVLLCIQNEINRYKELENDVAVNILKEFYDNVKNNK